MNQTAIITGASSGIGLALALEMGRQGYNLGLTARRTERLQALKEQLLAMPSMAGKQVEWLAMDVQDTTQVPKSMTALINKFAQVDVVVANAGANQLTGVGKGQLQEQLDMIQTNLLGAVATVDAAAEYFRARKAGHIVGISSLASLTPIPKQAAYCATKAGFSMYLDASAIELKRYNIHVTKILPGFVKTDIVDNMEQFPFLVSAEQAAREMMQHIRKRRSTGVVPGYPWRAVKPLLANMPSGLWRYIKI